MFLIKKTQLTIPIVLTLAGISCTSLSLVHPVKSNVAPLAANQASVARVVAFDEIRKSVWSKNRALAISSLRRLIKSVDKDTTAGQDLCKSLAFDAVCLGLPKEGLSLMADVPMDNHPAAKAGELGLLATCKNSLGDYRSAQIDLESALTVVPDGNRQIVDITFQLCLSSLMSGDKKSALKRLSEMEDYDVSPAFVEVYLELANLDFYDEQECLQTSRNLLSFWQPFDWESINNFKYLAILMKHHHQYRAAELFDKEVERLQSM